jgi:hypothetical protein
MEEALVQQSLLSVAQQNMDEYFKTHDSKYIAEDGVFIHMSNGEVIRGREAVGQFLHYIYHVAFDAKAVEHSRIVTEDKAVIEGHFLGKHIGEFAGIPATNREVNVPICVTYDLENGLIKQARVYMMMDSMMLQLTEN